MSQIGPIPDDLKTGDSIPLGKAAFDKAGELIENSPILGHYIRWQQSIDEGKEAQYQRREQSGNLGDKLVNRYTDVAQFPNKVMATAMNALAEGAENLTGYDRRLLMSVAAVIGAGKMKVIPKNSKLFKFFNRTPPKTKVQPSLYSKGKTGAIDVKATAVDDVAGGLTTTKTAGLIPKDAKSLMVDANIINEIWGYDPKTNSYSMAFDDSPSGYDAAPLTIMRGDNKYVSPEKLIEAATALEPQMTTKAGAFDTEAFAKHMGTIRKYENRSQGYFPLVSKDKKGNWKVDYRKERDQSRVMAEAIPLQVEKVIENWPLFGGPETLKQFKKWVTGPRGKVMQQVKAQSTPEQIIEGGHFSAVRGPSSKDTTLQSVPHIAENLGPEPKYGYDVYDEKGDFVRTAPGNEPKKNLASEHFDPKDVEIAGGGLSRSWEDVIARFMMEFTESPGNITGTITPKLTLGDKITARDQKINIQAMSMRRDRLNQLTKQASNFLQQGQAIDSYKLQRQPGTDPRTGLRGEQLIYKKKTYADAVRDVWSKDPAFEKVRADIEAKFGKGAIHDPNAPPQQGPLEKPRVKKDTRGPREIESQGRYLDDPPYGKRYQGD